MLGNFNTRRARAALAAMFASVSAAALLSPSAAIAQDQSREEAIVAYDIDAQPLSSALSEFARQSGVSVLYPYEQLRNRRAPAVRGRYAPEQALRLLLAGSGLNASVQADGSIRLEDPARPQPINADRDRASPDDTPADEEIVVTGTRIRGAPPAGANVLGLDRQDVEESGRTTLQEVLQTLPQVYSGSQSELTQLNSNAPGRNLALGSSVDLRGLGSDATLTLLDGRRLAPAGLGNFVDTHIVLRGRRADGRALVIPRDFVQHGFREAARDAATDRLGLRTRADERLALSREVRAHRPTRLDALLARHIEPNGEVRIARIAAPNGDGALTNAMKARARELQRLGLASAPRRNVLSFQSDWRARLTAMELHLDIRKRIVLERTLQQRTPDKGLTLSGLLRGMGR